MAAPGVHAQPPQTGRIFPAFAIIGWRWISRNPAVTIAPVLVPFMFLYFLHIITPSLAFPAEVIGAMIFVAQNVGNWVLGDSATYRIHLALQDMFVASPLGKVEYLMGIAMANMLAALPALVVLGAVLEYVNPLSAFGWMVLVGTILVTWVLFSAIGIAVSSRVKTRREIWPVGNFVFTALGMLSPLYYPLSALPLQLQYVARFLPGTYAALLAKGANGLIPATSAQLVQSAVLLIASAGAGLSLSLYLYLWRTE